MQKQQCQEGQSRQQSHRGQEPVPQIKLLIRFLPVDAEETAFTPPSLPPKREIKRKGVDTEGRSPGGRPAPACRPCSAATGLALRAHGSPPQLNLFAHLGCRKTWWFPPVSGSNVPPTDNYGAKLRNRRRLTQSRAPSPIASSTLLRRGGRNAEVTQDPRTPSPRTFFLGGGGGHRPPKRRNRGGLRGEAARSQPSPPSLPPGPAARHLPPARFPLTAGGRGKPTLTDGALRRDQPGH